MLKVLIPSKENLPGYRFCRCNLKGDLLYARRAHTWCNLASGWMPFESVADARKSFTDYKWYFL